MWHFTRADFPAFEGFANITRNFASNIRSTFVSLNRYQEIYIDGPNNYEIGVFKVVLRDTILLSPTGAKALADIGKIVGEEKIILHSDPKQEQHIKENMAQFLLDDWETFRKYAIQDSRVCVEYAEKIIRQSLALSGEFKMPITLTSFGTKQVLKSWEEAKWNKLDILGREENKENKYSKKKGYFVKKVSTPFKEHLYNEEAFITSCFHGGRNEQYIFGPAKEALWRDLDLSSAYPTAMSLIGYPDWNNVISNGDYKGNYDDIKPTDLAYFNVEFEFPEHIRFPTLPVRSSNGIIFPRKGTSNCFAPEFCFAKSLGAKLTVKRFIKVPTDASKPIFKPFIHSCILERKKHEKGTFGNYFWKEIGNSTYGKTAQGLKKRRIYDLRDDKMLDLGESRLTQPFFASFITSFTRAVLGEILNSLPKEVTVFSVTTDGFLSDAPKAFDELMLELPITQVFAKANAALTGGKTSDVIEEKHNVRQPFGYRTRSSFTLKVGEGKNNIVLQKGGIKTKVSGSPELENERLLNFS